MAKKALVFLADGFEEVEALTPVDFLRRAGIDVITVSLNENKVSTGSHAIPVQADMSFADISATFNADEWDAALVPGGGTGAANLAASEIVRGILKALNERNKLVAAICAAPVVVLYPLGLLEGRCFTCYPGMETRAPNAKFSKDLVVVDQNLITSRAAGTAAEWSISIIRQLTDDKTAREIAVSVLVQGVSL